MKGLKEYTEVGSRQSYEALFDAYLPINAGSRHAQGLCAVSNTGLLPGRELPGVGVAPT